MKDFNVSRRKLLQGAGYLRHGRKLRNGALILRCVLAWGLCR